MKTETICARSTPPGVGALGIVRVSGSRVQRVWEETFRRAQAPEARRVTLATYWDKALRAVDQVVVTYFEEGSSYTGEAMLEISAHGNPIIIQKILEDLQHKGCRMAEPGEFTRRAFLNGCIDLSQAEAVAHMIHARSEKALELAHKQLTGALGARIHKLSHELIQLMSQVEAYIDFSDEDLPKEDAQAWIQKIEALLLQIEKLLQSRRYSQKIYEGLKVLILGAPNAGKSSLLNALLGTDRALISSQPGTTRDYINEPWMLGDYPLQIIDTAGIHDAGSDLEAQGIQKTLELVEQADVFLWVLDATLATPPLPENVQKALNSKNTIVVENKVDLPAFFPHSETLPEARHVAIAAAQGTGIDALREAVLALIDTEAPQGEEDFLAIHERHAQALRATRESLCNALRQLQADAFLELVASDLRLGLSSLGEIVGKVDSEEILDVLFQTFCIGK